MKSLAVVALVFVLLAPADADAHQKSVSYSKWTLVDDGAVAEVRVAWLDLTSLQGLRQTEDEPFDRASVLRALQTRLVLEADAGPCEPIPSSTNWLPSERGWLRVEWRVRCPSPARSLQSELFPSLTNHVHLATVLGAAPVDVVLSSLAPTAPIGSTKARGVAGGIGSYLRLGIEHISSGWDHLAFLLLLIVVARRLREVALLVTGFTVGHSVTLAAAALGAVVPHARAVEATIAASILIVALENAGAELARGGLVVVAATGALFIGSAAFGGMPAFWGLALFTGCYFVLLRNLGGTRRLRWMIACLFGFVHGLGFSSVLLEQELAQGQLIEALFGFNLGVELGQLGLVLCCWPILQWLRNANLGDRVIDVTSVAGAALGVFALVVRVFG